MELHTCIPAVFAITKARKVLSAAHLKLLCIHMLAVSASRFFSMEEIFAKQLKASSRRLPEALRGPTPRNLQPPLVSYTFPTDIDAGRSCFLLPDTVNHICILSVTGCSYPEYISVKGGLGFTGCLNILHSPSKTL